MRGHDIIAIGGCAGGLSAIRDLLGPLPALPLSLFVVLHTPGELLARSMRC